MELSTAENWRRVFLKHVDLYLEGSKAPDDTFKDFKNHVLHVGDNYWGGAPDKVEAWYAHTVTALREQRWADAAYAAGVMTHYYTDPIHPFHTGQTEAENAIHRACEWSINRSYNRLRALGEAEFSGAQAAVPTVKTWLREMVCDGAEFSHRYYEKLIAHYDINIGATRPEEGLDKIAEKVVAELLMYAASGVGRLMDRAITDAGVEAPEVNLTLDTVMAGIKIPRKMLEKKLSDTADRAVVAAMYDELKATGRVDATLPEDDRAIRDLHAKEVLAPRAAALASARHKRITQGDPAEVKQAKSIAKAATKPVKPPVIIAKVEPVAVPTPTIADSNAALEDAVTKSRASFVMPAAAPPPIEPVVETARIVFATPEHDVTPEPQPEPAAETFGELTEPHSQPASSPEPSPAPAPVITVVASNPAPRSGTEQRVYLAREDDLEAAPSIGPKMAEAFANLGVRTVGDFLGQNPQDLAELLDDSRIDAETITDWQDQAMLVMNIPGLRGTHAQLLVGAGYRTRDAVADADPVDLSADVLGFATTSEGRRVLRDGNPPDIEKIKAWVTSAEMARAA
jgi:predicted flap endonuclease-1-like 5' DNA nuclease